MNNRSFPGKQNNDLRDLVAGYQLCARAEGLSENTIVLVKYAVGLLIEFLGLEGLSTEVDQIEAPELRSFIIYLQQKTVHSHSPVVTQDRYLSAQAINDYMRSVSAFWSWLEREDIIRVNPFYKVKIPPAPRLVITPYSEDQLNALLAVIDTETPVGFRDSTITLTLTDTGTRVSETCNLMLEDADLGQRLLKVRGKGAKERLVPIGAKVQRAIWKYVQRYRPEPAVPWANYLFLTRDGRQLTRRHIGTIFRRYGQKTGLAGVRFYPHRFRHTFAINYLKNGGDVFSLQRILGHSSLDIVKIYVHLATEDIQEAHRRYSPVDNLELRFPRRHTRTNR